jgi:antitoxin VapB
VPSGNTALGPRVAPDPPARGVPYEKLQLVDSRSTAALKRPMLWHMPDSASRYVKLFTNGRNQAVRIPREFELPGEDAIMRKEGDRLIIEPAPPRSLLALLATLEPIDEDFPAVSNLPIDDVEI